MRLQNVISKTSWESLLASKSSFTWIESSGEEQYDGPTMLFILVSKVRPSTKIDVQLFKNRIRTSHAAKFGNNIQRLTDYVRTNYDAIVDIGGEYNDLIGDLFTILSTAKNTTFCDFISRERIEWNRTEDDSINVESLLHDSLLQYHNMVASGDWNKTDNMDSKITSLLTDHLSKVGFQSHNHKKNTSKPPSNQSKPSLNHNKKSSIKGLDAWRMTKDGDSKTMDGKTYYWCPDHKYPGNFDGLYMPHRPGEGHRRWKEKRDNRRSLYKKK